MSCFASREVPPPRRIPRGLLQLVHTKRQPAEVRTLQAVVAAGEVVAVARSVLIETVARDETDPAGVHA